MNQSSHFASRLVTYLRNTKKLKLLLVISIDHEKRAIIGYWYQLKESISRIPY